MQTVGRLTTAISQEVTLDYLLHIPANYEDSKDKLWPLILFLHGSGERGDDPQLVAATGLPKFIENRPDFPCIVVSPQCPIPDAWTQHIDALIALLDDISTRYSVDQNRIYLSGLSLGGQGVWYLGAKIPHRIAAVVPICGPSFPELSPKFVGVPVWAFHGQQDPVVSVQQSLDMVAAINQAGGSAKLTVYPDAEHDSWTQTYEDPQLYEWLLSQNRS